MFFLPRITVKVQFIFEVGNEIQRQYVSFMELNVYSRRGPFESYHIRENSHAITSE